MHITVLAEDQTGAAVIDMMEANQNTIADPSIVNLDPDPAVFDPRLTTDSPALTAGCAMTDPFFDPVSYVGAFDAQTIWLQDWTGMDANLFFAFVTATQSAELDNQLSVFPNPTNGMLNLEGLTQAATLQLYAIDGQLLVEQEAGSGAGYHGCTRPV